MTYLELARQAIKEREEHIELTIGDLADLASRLPGVPVIRLTMYESEDVEGDVAFLRRVRELLRQHPGANRVVLTIRTLDGRKVLAEWRTLSSPQLRKQLADFVKERTLSLGLVFKKSSFTCLSCGQRSSGRDNHGRIFCRDCRRDDFS